MDRPADLLQAETWRQNRQLPLLALRKLTMKTKRENRPTRYLKYIQAKRRVKTARVAVLKARIAVLEMEIEMEKPLYERNH